MPSWTLPEGIYPPLQEKLELYVRDLRERREDTLDFVVLYGSAACGRAGPGSDLDLLIGLRSDEGLRFRDRFLEFDELGTGAVEPFVYYPGEIDAMQAGLHTTLLEAVADGRVLFDRGRWRLVQEDIGAMMGAGLLVRLPRGWKLVRPELVRERERALRGMCFPSREDG